MLLDLRFFPTFPAFWLSNISKIFFITQSASYLKLVFFILTHNYNAKLNVGYFDDCYCRKENSSSPGEDPTDDVDDDGDGPPGEDPPDEVHGVPLVDVAVREVHLELLHHQPDVLLSELVRLQKLLKCFHE